MKTLHLNSQTLTHTVILLCTWLTSSLLAADICQLCRRLQYTSLMPAFRCCRLTHPRTIKLTRSWFAQTRAGMAWGKTLLVSSSWLIPSGYAVNRTDTQTSYTELKLCFTSTGTKVVSHPCNYVHSTVVLSYFWKTWLLMSHNLAAILLWEILIFLQCPGPLTSAYICNICWHRSLLSLDSPHSQVQVSQASSSILLITEVFMPLEKPHGYLRQGHSH